MKLDNSFDVHMVVMSSLSNEIIDNTNNVTGNTRQDERTESADADTLI